MDPDGIYHCLTRGIDELSHNISCVPSELILTGSNPVPISALESGEVLIAAAIYGKGRIVVLSHEGYIIRDEFRSFILNALVWLQSCHGKTIGISKSLHRLKNILDDKEFTVTHCDDLENIDVFCCACEGDFQKKKVLQFVKNGGGLLIGGQAWHWASQNTDKNVLEEFPGNQITAPAGIYFSGRSVGCRGTVNVSGRRPCHQPSLRLNFQEDDDLKILLSELDGQDLECDWNSAVLFSFDQKNFPVPVSCKRSGLAVAGRLGTGRFVATSKSTIFETKNGQIFLQNILKWLLKSDVTGPIAFDDEMNSLSKILDPKFECTEDDLDNVRVYCCSAMTQHQPAAIEAFVAEGGGLLWCGSDWHMSDLELMKKSVSEFPGNKVLNPLGVGILPPTMNGDVFNSVRCTSVNEMLSQFISNENDCDVVRPYENLVKDIAEALKIRDYPNPSYDMLVTTLKDLVVDNGILDQNEKEFKKPKEKLALAVAADLYDALTDKATLLPHRQSFDLEKELSIKIEAGNAAAQCRWESTGFYTPPATPITIVVPQEIVDGKWQVQIGCQTDNLFNISELRRAPVAVRRVPIKQQVLKIEYLWGGLIYFIVPANSKLGQLEVTFKNVVRAPYFALKGSNTVLEWQQEIRHHPAPWAELAADNIILTLPSSFIRDLDDPRPVLQLWNEIMRHVARLSAIPEQFPRPERIVADVQISAGSMHSGYPIMVHDTSAKEMVDLERISSVGLWGFIHELGHNQQNSKWEICPHTTEATCNLWSIYVHEKVLNVPSHRAHGCLAAEKRRQRIEEHVGKGASLSTWHVWTCLETYLQLQEAFGWDAFIEVHRLYHGMEETGSSNESKMNTYAQVFSNQVKKNLAPFFAAWGWPIEQSVAAKLFVLEEWVEDPMKLYQKHA
ncbi:TRPM8 channel-associated factor 2 isoform X2 [Hyalella azteca]|uniref:TRPM8 channel-associated factor 2 isoform X2 n=1 Tax=Hyalella azteca TaxID=294128 RepID=A0A979FJ40_HYAAZ|nr:TRPM8 channel-associated factor 2 isoform X2 [Hyalella azteca]